MNRRTALRALGAGAVLTASGLAVPAHAATPSRRRVLLGGSTWTPANLGSAVRFWLAAHKLTGLNSGDALASWTDLTSNGNTPTQSTGARKPTYTTGLQAAKPGITFGSLGCMVFTDVASMEPTNHIGIFAAIKTPASFATAPALFFKNISGGSSLGLYFTGTPGKMTLATRGDAVARAVSASSMTGIAASTVAIVGVTWDTDISTFYANGAQVDRKDNSADGDTTLLTNGSAPFLGSWSDQVSNLWAGDIYEILFIALGQNWDQPTALRIMRYLDRNWQVY